MSDILSLDYQSSWEEFQRNERVKELPLRIRIALRDTYYKPTHAVPLALSSLRTELGGPATLSIDWGHLWSLLSPEFPDLSTFVPAISTATAAFISAVETCISADEDWGSQLLDRMKAQDKTTLELYLLVDVTIVAPKVIYLAQNAGLAVKLPKAGEATYSAVAPGMLVGGLRGVFEEAEQGKAEWEVSGIDGVKVPQLENAALGAGSSAAAAGGIVVLPGALEKFPDIQSAPRPDMLLEKPPYIATVRVGEKLEIECNHQKSLDFVATYLEHHASPHPTQTGNKMWKVQRWDSYFGNGLVFDRIVVEEGKSNWGISPSPMLVLSLLQGTLGYLVDYTDGRCWVLKREARFAPR